ncbi:MAG: S8 family serine peptidase [Acidobacteriota bacterium]|nr:S8 family serine peptidase [Acidobacteriota bacterium]
MRFSRLPVAAGVLVTCGLATAAPISAAPATPWNLELARGRTAPTTVTVVNRCRAVHAFEVTGDPKAPWLSFPGPTTVSPPPGGGLTVNAIVDARALDPGDHHAAVAARCLDCGSEPLCSQNRDLFDARLKVLWSEEDLRSFEPSELFPGEVLAVLEAGADRRKIEKQFSLRSEGSFELPTIGATIVRFRTAGPERPLAAALGALQKDPGVRLAQPNFLYRVEQRSTNDPFRDRQYALDSLGVSRVHDKTTGRGVTVAVLDSFVNPKHPDLPGALAESADFFSKAPPVLAEGHGVAMTGIIAARANNGVGIAGVAPDTTVLSVRVCGSPSERAHEICSSDAIARGLDLAVARKARVVSMSLAGPYDPLVARLVYRASEGGTVLVAATGNDGLATVKYPAAYEPVLAVTAIDRQDHLYEKANRGARVDLAAPGVDVFSLASPQLFGPTTGTSPAAAQVSGVVALLLQLRPDFSPAQVRQLLEETARDLGPPGRDEQFGSGAVDACRAVSKLTGDPTPCR